MAATWKRQKVTVSGYKFDYVDVNEFHTNSILARIRYCGPFILALKSILMYMADISILILTFIWMSEGCDTKNVSSLSTLTGSYCERATARSQRFIPMFVRPYIILASVALSFILLGLDWKKAWAIIKSGDISYAFTSNIASRYYTLKSYPHFCFFLKIKDSRNWIERLAFFVFFVFKGWKRLLFAEFPRQALNALMIFDVIDPLLRRNSTSNGTVTALFEDEFGFGLIAGAYSTIFRPGKTTTATKMSLALQTFTVLMWLLSVTGLIVAFCIYLPLLAKIKGNLKEYCCHKIDVRLEELLQKKYRKKQGKHRKDMDFGEAGSRYSGSSSGFSSRHGKDQNYNAYPPPPNPYDQKQYYVAQDQQTSYSGDDPYAQNYYNPYQNYQDPRYQYNMQPQQPYRDGSSDRPDYYPQQRTGYNNQPQAYDQDYDNGYYNNQGSQSPHQRQQYQQYDDGSYRQYERSNSRQGGLSTPSDTTFVEDNPRQRQYDEYELQPPRQPHQYRQQY